MTAARQRAPPAAHPARRTPPALAQQACMLLIWHVMHTHSCLFACLSARLHITRPRLSDCRLRPGAPLAYRLPRIIRTDDLSPWAAAEACVCKAHAWMRTYRAEERRARTRMAAPLPLQQTIESCSACATPPPAGPNGSHPGSAAHQHGRCSQVRTWGSACWQASQQALPDADHLTMVVRAQRLAEVPALQSKRTSAAMSITTPSPTDC
jgi:hypothetical protein